MASQTPYRQRIAQALANGRPILASNECQYLCLVLAEPTQDVERPTPLTAENTAAAPIWFAQRAKTFAELNIAIPTAAQPVVDANWPGPLVIQIAREGAADPMRLQVPSDSFLREVLATVEELQGKPSTLCGFPVMLPSGLPCTELPQVFEALDLDNAEAALGHFSYVLDGGLTKHGVQPTVLDFSQPTISEADAGPLDVNKLAGLLGDGFVQADVGPANTRQDKPQMILLQAAEMLTLEPVGLARVIAPQSARKKSDRENWRYLPADAPAYARGLYGAVQDAVSEDVATLYIDVELDHPSLRAAVIQLKRLFGAHAPSGSTSESA